MNVLILGGGGREHVLAWKISQSAKLAKLFIAPGNAGTGQLGTNADLNPEDFQQVGDFVNSENVDMVIVGPEAPLVAGIGDYFREREDLREVALIGPDKKAAHLEGSKNYAKEFMQRHAIPTAPYRSFGRDQIQEAKDYLKTLSAPYVLKADGLAAGKGVVIAQDIAIAERELGDMFSGKFGGASEKVVIEEFLEGREFSVFALCDGKHSVLLPVAKDYKRLGQGDSGPNTGGMGAVSPVSYVDAALLQMIKQQIVDPTIDGLKKEGVEYRGFLFFGLMEVAGKPYVIEYNARLGDPEAQAVLPRIKNDLLEVFTYLDEGRLNELQLEVDDQHCAAVVAVSEGYPGSYPKGKEITGLENVRDAQVFHAGAQLHNDGKIRTSGGRVMALTGMGKSQEEALSNAYKAAKTVCFDGIGYREDIGYDA